MKEQLEEILNNRILVLDGAMGTMIQMHNLNEADFRGPRFADHASDVKGNNDLLVLTQPKIIEDIHVLYLEAGADIIETNTFNSNAISMADYHMEGLAHELNVVGAQVARRAVDRVQTKHPDRKCFVAGALDRKSTRLNSSHTDISRMPSSA